ncbi:hypothetical protein ABW19_dt0205061 [Dactylella cylindrospora]|nr:hypothetical protein ABW19_dt0205061 [Dactylella cylindrospora]
MVEHEEVFDEDEFTRRVLGDDGMSSGSEGHGESSTSPVLLNQPRRSLLEDDDDDDDDDDDEDNVVSSSDEDDDDVVDLIKESIKPSELHLSDDDLEDPGVDDEIDSDDESDLPSVLPLRIVKSPQPSGSPALDATGTSDKADSPTAEEVNIITLDKIDEQLTDPTIGPSRE